MTDVFRVKRSERPPEDECSVVIEVPGVHVYEIEGTDDLTRNHYFRK